MVQWSKKILILLFGWLFIVLGIVGLFLPILQGILFIVIGLMILSKESTVAKGIVFHFKKRYPKPFEIARNARNRLVEKFTNWSLK